MADLIDRQAAIDAVEFGITYAKAFNKPTGEVKELFKEGNKALNEAVERLKALPSAQRTGRWIEDSGNIACSECHIIWLHRRTAFCPNCGAKMEEQDERA